jgi:hypothetical protein
LNRNIALWHWGNPALRRCLLLFAGGKALRQGCHLPVLRGLGQTGPRSHEEVSSAEGADGVGRHTARTEKDTRWVLCYSCACPAAPSADATVNGLPSVDEKTCFEYNFTRLRFGAWLEALSRHTRWSYQKCLEGHRAVACMHSQEIFFLERSPQKEEFPCFVLIRTVLVAARPSLSHALRRPRAI